MIFFLFFLQKVPEKSQKVRDTKKGLNVPKSSEKCQKDGFLRIGDTIGACQKTQCLPYEVFFVGLKS